MNFWTARTIRRGGQVPDTEVFLSYFLALNPGVPESAQEHG